MSPRRIILIYDRTFQEYSFYNRKKDDPEKTEYRLNIRDPESHGYQAIVPAEPAANMGNPNFKPTPPITFKKVTKEVKDLDRRSTKIYIPKEKDGR